MTVRIFYRDRSGYDTKVIGWSKDLSSPVMFRGYEITSQENQYISHLDLEVNDLSYQEVTWKGLPTKKVISGALVDRDPADIDKDYGNKPFIQRNADLDVGALLQGKRDTQWLMTAVYQTFIYLKSLQEAIPLSDSLLSQAGQDAKAALQDMETNMVGPIVAIRTQEATSIAALDPED